jgi:ABC-2 type transport system permease protein
VTVAVYREFARVGFVNILAFRLRYYTGVLTYLINVSVYYFIWKALYAAEGAIGGMRFGEMVTYVAVGWMIRSLYFNTIDQDMAQDIMDGKIAMALVKPVSVQWMYIAQSLGETAFRLGMLSLPVSIVLALVFPVEPPKTAAHGLLMLVSLAGSILLVASLNFLVGSCAVTMKSILGLLRAKFFVQDLLSGLLIPMALFPEPLRGILAYLPFQHIGSTPMLIYLGKLSSGEIAQALAAQALWVAALLVLGDRFWRRMARRMTIHGG